MPCFLSYAQAPESTGTTLQLMLLWLGVVVGAALLAFIPARVARARRSYHAEMITAFAVLWAFAAAGSVIYDSIAQSKWSRERLLRLQSGYYDLATDAQTLPRPWAQWGGLGAIYGVLLARASIGGTPKKAED